MKFWGDEVKSGQPLKVAPGDGMVLHLSQACLGESENEKGNESVCLFVSVDGKKLLIGKLFTNELPLQQFDLVFDRDFELSHNWKSGSVYFCGYKANNPEEDELSRGECDGCESEEDIPLTIPNNGMVEKAAKMKKNLERKAAAAAALAVGAGSSSHPPRPSHADKKPFPACHRANITPAYEPIHNHVDEESEHNAPQLERCKVRHDPARTSAGAMHSKSPSPVSEIVNQYETYLLRDRFEHLGEKNRPRRSNKQTLTPDWHVYPNNSILGPNGVTIASEMMRHVVLPMDKATLMTVSHSVIEDMVLESAARIALGAHQLAMNISCLKHENTELNTSFAENRSRLDHELNEAQKKTKEIEQFMKEKEAMTQRSAELESLARNRGNELLMKDARIETLAKESEARYQAGIVEGQKIFTSSSGYKTALDEARFNGACDFKNSTAYKALILDNASEYVYDGFMKALDYLEKDKLLVPGFNLKKFEKLVSADPLRPSIVAPLPDSQDFPEFNSLGPAKSDTDEDLIPEDDCENTYLPVGWKTKKSLFWITCDEDDDEDKDGDDDEDEDDSDDESGESDEETPKKAEPRKNGPSESATRTPLQDKKANVTPQKIDGEKVSCHVATPHLTKQAGMTPDNNKPNQQMRKSGGSYFCWSCNRMFGSERALGSHSRAKHA